jgi:hypothetical protein
MAKFEDITTTQLILICLTLFFIFFVVLLLVGNYNDCGSIWNFCNTNTTNVTTEWF